MDYLPKLGLEDFKGGELCKTLKSCVAEMIGVLFLVLIGCGSAYNHHPETDVVRIALGFGVTVATMAQSIGHISGCHINPAVTAGLLVGKKISFLKALLYVPAQCLGGIFGALLLKGLLGLEDQKFPGTTDLSKEGIIISPGQGFGIEFFMTFVLVMVVFGSAADDIAAKKYKRICSTCNWTFHFSLHPICRSINRRKFKSRKEFGTCNHWKENGRSLGLLVGTNFGRHMCFHGIQFAFPGRRGKTRKRSI